MNWTPSNFVGNNMKNICLKRAPKNQADCAWRGVSVIEKVSIESRKTKTKSKVLITAN